MLSFSWVSCSDPVDIVLGGSIMVAAGSLFVDGVREGIRELAPRARVVVCRDRPVVGAAIAGLEMVGSDPVAAARVRAMLDDSRIRVAPDLNGGPPPSTGPVPPLLLP